MAFAVSFLFQKYFMETYLFVYITLYTYMYICEFYNITLI